MRKHREDSETSNFDISNFDSANIDYLLSGFLRTWVLVQAKNEAGVCGQSIMDLMAGFDHEVSPGTIYPMLGRLVKLGFLRKSMTPYPSRRIIYRLTKEGEWGLDKVLMIIESILGRDGSRQSGR
jgi:DNA-binding PadR family transcriptional regulator